MNNLRYQVNPTEYSDIFAFPKNVVTNHIRLAGAAQLKVLLWLFSHGGSCSDTADISKDIGLNVSDVNDAMQYWVVNKIVNCDDESSIAVVENKTEAAVTPLNEPITDIPEKPENAKNTVAKAPRLTSTEISKPSRFEAAKRMNESPEIAWLLNEAQNRFGHPLSNADMTTLVWLADAAGISPAIIVMVIEYAVSLNKCSIRYIEKTALSWIDSEIDTVEKAESYLVELEHKRQDWFKVSKVFGINRTIPSAKESIYAARWLREWHFSSKMLKEAYDRCVDSTGKISFGYINKILDKWHSEGITKPDDAKNSDLKHNAAKKQESEKSENKSYDIDEIHNLLFSDNSDGDTNE